MPVNRGFIVVLAIMASWFIMPAALNAQNKTVTMTTCDWEPHYGSTLLNNGYFFEVTEQAFKKAGYDVTIKFLPWKRALKLTAQGDYDCLMGAFKTEKREKDFTFSKSISEANTVFFTMKNKKITYNKFKDLVDYKIGIVRGYHNSEEFDSINYLRKIESSSSGENLRLLLLGRLDLIVDGQKTIIYLINRDYPEYIDQIECLSPPLEINPLYNIFSKKRKNHKQLADDFNRGLDIIKKDGTFHNILKKHGF